MKIEKMKMKFVLKMTNLPRCTALVFSVGAGLALGKEGPLIQIGACWGPRPGCSGANYEVC